MRASEFEREDAARAALTERLDREIAQDTYWRDDRRANGHDPATTSIAPSLSGVDLCDIEIDLNTPYIVKGLLTAQSLIGIVGEPGCGKTFFATDLACHIAASLVWRGHKIRGGLVIYAALEGAHSAKNRFGAWRKEFASHMTGSIPLRLTPGPVNLRDPAHVEALIEFVKRTESEHGTRCQMVFVDTLSRSMAGGDENSPEDMGALIRGGDAVRQRCETAVGLVHHLGKDRARGARGHSSLIAALDTEIEIAEEGDIRIATATKQRDLASGGQWPFKLRVVELGTDGDGDPVTTCLCDRVNLEDMPVSKKSPRGKIQQQLLRHLEDEHRAGTTVWSVADIRKIATEHLKASRQAAHAATQALLDATFLSQTVGGLMLADPPK